jgi:hypothetical protein
MKNDHNDPCHCGSGQKSKNCFLDADRQRGAAQASGRMAPLAPNLRDPARPEPVPFRRRAV